MMVEAGPRSESANRRDRNGNINIRDHHNRQCAGDQDDADDVNTFKILVSTDNHLGFNEECPIRGDDSFVSFEEVLQLAQKEQVDFVLLGGDLFHKNKPSRRSMFKCINLLRKYSLGNKPCEFEFLGDPDQTFPHSSFPWANSSTKLCLFGLSSIRDERLHRMFRAGKVNILFPELSQQEKDSADWFHLMVLHQNHAKHGPTSHIPESFLHPNLDLIVWGHEHEAMERPVHNPTQDFYVLQPGSSVATSLSPGEAAPKNSWLVHIRGDKFKADKVPLETVRPFVFRDLNLFEESKIDRRKPKCREKVKAFCSQVVEDMIDEAKLQHTGNPKQPIDKPLLRLRLHYVTDSNTSFGGSDVGGPNLNGSAGDAPLNVALFGKEFVDRVANAKDLVTLHRRTEQEMKEKNALMRSLSSDVRDALTSSIQDNNSTTNLHTTVVSIVKQFFHSADETEHKYKLSVLTETGLSLATQEFVDKEEKAALHSIVGHQIKKTVDYTVGNLKSTPDDETQFEDELVKYRKDRFARAKQLYTSAQHDHTTTTDDVSRNVTAEFDVTESQQDAMAELAEALKHHEKETTKSNAGPAVDLTTMIDSDEQEEYDKIMESTRINSRGAATSSTKGTRGRGRGRGSKATAKTASAANVKKAPSGNSTLDLTKLAVSDHQNFPLPGKLKFWRISFGNLKSTPDDETQFEDELVKYRKDRFARAKQLYTSAQHDHTTTTDDVSRNVTAEFDVTESQQDAMAELAEALKHHEKETTKSNAGPAVDLTTMIDSDEQEEYDKIMESTRINSRGAATSSTKGTRGRGRGRGSKATAKTASAANVKKAPSGNSTLDLTKLAGNKTQTKLQIKPEPDSDDVREVEAVSVSSSRISNRAVKRPAVVEQIISDDDGDDYDKDTVDQSYQPVGTSKRTTGATDEQSQNVFSRRMSAAMRNNASASTSSALFSGSQRSGASGNQGKLARRF
ncbi:uncharacterized protein LOC142336755 [Convolutriloba macropyga]|uniref:uncharacterized protein LOC142336755 n=1 Tax=Convolutriloba macropyga TaxID=536237 RepID=UPI003F51F6B2